MTMPWTLPALPAPGIDWAALHMPLLQQTFDEVGAVFAGLRIAICLHIEPKTAVRCRLASRPGATGSRSGAPGLPEPVTVDALRARGVTVHAPRSDERRLLANLRAVDSPVRTAHHAVRALAVQAGEPAHPHRGGTDETTPGADRERA